MGLLFIPIIFLLILFAIVLNFGLAIFRIFWSGINPFKSNQSKNSRKGYSSHANTRQSAESTSPKSKKVFKDSDGEYVDFEEIK